MKKFLALIISILLVSSLCSCGNESGEVSNDTRVTSSQTESTDTKETQTSEADKDKSSSDTEAPSNSTPTPSTETSNPTTSTSSTHSTPLIPTAPSTPSVSEIDALTCLGHIMLSDSTNYYDNMSKYQFVYDLVLLEHADSKFAIKKVKVIGATVDGEKNCQILQTNTKVNARNLANKYLFDSEFFENLDEQLIDWGYKEVETACRIISPNLTEEEYGDFKVKIEIEFENSALTTVELVGSQGIGEGGFAYDCLSNSDYL